MKTGKTVLLLTAAALNRFLSDSFKTLFLIANRYYYRSNNNNLMEANEEGDRRQ